MRTKPLYGTPILAMIDELAEMGMSMKEAAGLLLSDDGAIPRSVAVNPERRSTLTKRFKQARPGALAPKDFRSFSESVPELLAATCANAKACYPKLRDASIRAMLLDRLSGPSERTMERALLNYALDPGLYGIALKSIMDAADLFDYQRLELAFMLFVATGCLADARKAVEITDRHARRKYSFTVIDGAPSSDAEAAEASDCRPLCLLRIIGSGVIGRLHVLDSSRGDYIIGSKPTSDGPTITDVDETVSENHLLVYCRGGHWWAEDCGSLHGTMVESSRTGKRTIIGAPANEKADETNRSPVELRCGDALFLGSTVFFVLRYQDV